MYHHTMLSIIIISMLFMHLASAVTLNDFTPYLTDLTPACKAVYTSEIAGCTGDDFQSGKCSSSCVSGLLSAGQAVRNACQKDNQYGIVGAFLNNQGVAELCPNINSNADQDQSSSSIRSTATYAIGSSTMTVSDTTFSTTGIIVDTASVATTVVSLSTATIQPVGVSSSSTGEAFVGVTSTITGTSLAFATSTPSSVLMATQTRLSSTTHSAAKHTQSSGTSGGTPFDSSAASNAFDLTLLGGALVALMFLLA